jgi:hypothetical protein
MFAIEFSPQSASVINVEQSEGARAKDADVGATTISAKAAILYNRVIDWIMQNMTLTYQFVLAIRS